MSNKKHPTLVHPDGLPVELEETFHKNGQLAYTQSKVYVPDSLQNERQFLIRQPDGKAFLRFGRLAKYFENGQLAFEMEHDFEGAYIKGDVTNFRKDGTPISYR